MNLGSLWDEDAEAAEFARLLLPELQAAARLGAASLLSEARSLGLIVDWLQADVAAREWARQYAGKLVKQVGETTRANIRETVGQFFDTPGMNRGQLERLLLNGDLPGLQTATRIYPPAERAEMIAVTEVTRAYSGGSLAAAQATGLQFVQPKQMPPAHVRCRCAATLFVRKNGQLSWMWHTRNDELVCEICGPLNGIDLGVS